MVALAATEPLLAGIPKLFRTNLAHLELLLRPRNNKAVLVDYVLG